MQWMIVAVRIEVILDDGAARRLSDLEDSIEQAQANGWELRFVVVLDGYAVHYLSKP